MPKRGQFGAAVALHITRLCVGYARAPSAGTCSQIFGVPAGWPWTLPAGQRVRRVVAGPDAGDRVDVGRGVGVKPVVQSAEAVVPPVPAVLPPEKIFLTCQVLSAFGPVSCSGNMSGRPPP